ncbi:hypothetical protein [Bacillus cereus]|uniref:hypothetical protein n=1 Tax=Bacillus cereus TaxID=1396 RepID=UPI0018F5F2FF|nr:hypothetical protein [Bacillus cereus]MBJ7939066.1 hypothetical protein [Bacillus cereus]
MHDFSNVINLEKLINSSLKNNTSFTGNLNSTDKTITSYLDLLYSRILYACGENKKYLLKAAILQSDYKEIEFSEKIYDFTAAMLHLEKEQISLLYLNQDIDLDRNSAFKISNFLLESYKKKLNSLLINTSREHALQYFYMISSIISHITSISHYQFKYKIIPPIEKTKDYINLIIDTIGIIYDENQQILNGLTGSEKKIFEYLVHYILNEQLDFVEIDHATLDIEEIILTTANIIHISQYQKSINSFYKLGYKFEIKDSILRIEDGLEIKINHFLKRTSEITIDIDSPESRNIYKMFEKKRGYSPFLLEQYIRSESKFLNSNYISNIIEKDALIIDMCFVTGKSRETIIKLLEDLSLNLAEDFFKEAFGKKNRIFRTPLIQIKNYFLISHMLLIEAAHLFRIRLLKDSLNTTIDNDTQNEITKTIDEQELNNLALLFKENNVVGQIGFELNKYNDCKELFKEKGVKQELDAYFIQDNILYIIELKNREPDRSLKELVGSITVNNKHIIKLLKLKHIVMQNKEIMQYVLGGEFSEVHIFLTYTNPNFSEHTHKFEDNITICNYKDCFEFCKRKIH